MVNELKIIKLNIQYNDTINRELVWTLQKRSWYILYQQLLCHERKICVYVCVKKETLCVIYKSRKDIGIDEINTPHYFLENIMKVILK